MSIPQSPTSDGKRLIAGPYILDAATLELHTRNYYNQPGIITPDGKTWIREGDWNQAAEAYDTIFWDLETDQARFTLPEAGAFGSNSLSPDGAELVTITTGSIRFWNTQTGTQTRQIPWDSRVTAITFGPLSIPTTTVQFALFAANYQGQVQIIDPQSGQMIDEYAVTSAPILDIAIHPNGKLLGFTVAEVRSRALPDVQPGKRSLRKTRNRHSHLPTRSPAHMGPGLQPGRSGRRRHHQPACHTRSLEHRHRAKSPRSRRKNLVLRRRPGSLPQQPPRRD